MSWFVTKLGFEAGETGFDVGLFLGAVPGFDAVGEAVPEVGEGLIAEAVGGVVDGGVEVFEGGGFFDDDVEMRQRCLTEEGGTGAAVFVWHGAGFAEAAITQGLDDLAGVAAFNEVISLDGGHGEGGAEVVGDAAHGKGWRNGEGWNEGMEN